MRMSSSVSCQAPVRVQRKGDHARTHCKHPWSGARIPHSPPRPASSRAAGNPPRLRLARGGCGACKHREIVPMDTFTSILDEPSRGSNSSRYSPLGSDSDQGMVSISSEASPPSAAHSLASSRISLDMTSSFFCTSPARSRCSGAQHAAQRAFADRMAMVLQARATVSMRSRTSRKQPVPFAVARQYWVRVLRA